MRCDSLGCVAQTPDASVSVVLDPRAFAEDCARADIIVSPLFAPPGCGARLVLDRASLARTGAVALRFEDERIDVTAERSPGEDRPWSRALRALAAFARRPIRSEEPPAETPRSSDLDP
jgi:competence protein ComEC